MKEVFCSYKSSLSNVLKFTSLFNFKLNALRGAWVVYWVKRLILHFDSGEHLTVQWILFLSQNKKIYILN